MAEVLGPQESGSETPGNPLQKGVSRRHFIAGAATVGTATAVAAMLPASGLGRNSAPAPAAQQGVASAAAAGSSGAPTDQVVAHVRNVSTGEIDLYVGTRQVSYRDPDLAAKLAHAAA